MVLEKQAQTCVCGFPIPSGHQFCSRCGLSAASTDVGTVLDEAFGGEDVPTRVADPDTLSREALRDGESESDSRVARVRVERVKGARPPLRTPRPIPPWVPMAQRDDIPAIDAPTFDDLPVQRGASATGSGFGKGLVIGFGIAGFLFGVFAVGVAGVVVYTHGLAPSAVPAPVTVAASAPSRAVVPAATPLVEKPAPTVAPAPVAQATPVIVAKAAPVTTPLIVPKAVPVATPVVVAKAAPVATPVIVAKARPASTPVFAAPVVAAPKPRSVAAAPVRSAPVPTVAPAPAKPSHDELLSLATSARRTATPAAPAATVAVAAPTNAPDPFAAPTATPAPFMPVDEPAVAAANAGSAANDAELADLLGAPAPAAAIATPTPAPKPKKVSSKDTGERVIHSRNGDKPVFLNANIALTRADGKTLVGKLLGVVDGFVDVKTSDSHVRIAENDVVDAATY